MNLNKDDVVAIVQSETFKITQQYKTTTLTLFVMSHSGQEFRVAEAECRDRYVFLKIVDSDGTARTEHGVSQPLVFLPYDEIRWIRVQ